MRPGPVGVKTIDSTTTGQSNLLQVVTIVDTRPPAAGSDFRRRAPTGAGAANAVGAEVTLGSVGEPQDLALFLSNAVEWEGPKVSSRDEASFFLLLSGLQPPAIRGPPESLSLRDQRPRNDGQISLKTMEDLTSIPGQPSVGCCWEKPARRFRVPVHT